jgi:phage/plasmid-like protein (TIGR03299 family)
MSHEIAKTAAGADAMAYVGETPWHGLGMKLDESADLQTWASASGLDFELDVTPVQNGEIKLEGKQIIYRKDTQTGLAVVSDNYKVVQPIEVLNFFKEYVNGTAQLETAGVLHDGKRYWAMAKLDGEINIAGDISKPYILLSSSCDGSLATQARLTTVRVVCNNTLQMATQGRADVVVRHNTVFDAADARMKLEGVYESLAAHTAAMKSLASIRLSNKKAEDFLNKLYGTEDKLGRQPRRIMELFTGDGLGADQDSSKGTAFGLLNAFTQYSDWEAGRNQNNRLFNTWFGGMANRKIEIANKLLEMV